MVFGESAKKALQREFLEESGLEIKVGDFVCCTEYIKSPLHAVELFFWVQKTGGLIQTGSDPEVSRESQIIQNVKFLSFEELSNIPDDNKHSLLHGVKNSRYFDETKGYRKFPLPG